MIGHFKNVELARLYGVSEKAVRNWIEASVAKKLKLELVAHKGRWLIADTSSNLLIIQQLVVEGQKFRNRPVIKTVQPSSDFYNTYSRKQIIDIANCIDKYREIPSNYRYFGKGAENWNIRLERLYTAGASNMLTTTIELLDLERSYFDFILSHYSAVNIIDLGVGNGLAAKNLMAHLHKSGKLHKYIGIDSSPELLNITEKNINDWFNREIVVEKHLLDITHERFADIITSSSDNMCHPVNLLLFLGGTLGNLRDPSMVLRNIRDSMAKEDILITSDELDNEGSRKYLGSAGVESLEQIIERNKAVLKLMNLHESLYSIERFFDEKHSINRLQIRLNFDTSFIFNGNDFYKTISVNKGEAIMLFQMREWTGHQLDNLFEENGFTQIRTTKVHNQEFVLLVSTINTKSK